MEENKDNVTSTPTPEVTKEEKPVTETTKPSETPATTPTENVTTTPEVKKEDKKKGKVTNLITLALSAIILLLCFAPAFVEVDGEQKTILGFVALLGEDGLISNSLSFLSSGLVGPMAYFGILLNISAYVLLGVSAVILVYSIVALFTDKLDKFRKPLFLFFSACLGVGVMGPMMASMFNVIFLFIGSNITLERIINAVKDGTYICLLWAILSLVLNYMFYFRMGKKDKNKKKKGLFGF